MRPPLSALVWLVAGCAPTYNLEQPLEYRPVSEEERISVPCYYEIERDTDALLVGGSRSKVALGRALAVQLQTGLRQLCHSAGRVGSRDEFLAIAGTEPSLFLTVRAGAEMRSTVFGSTPNLGSVTGDAELAGLGGAGGPVLHFDGSGARWGSWEMPSGTEGLQEAIRVGVQDLLDQMREDRASLERLARGETASPPP